MEERLTIFPPSPASISPETAKRMLTQVDGLGFGCIFNCGAVAAAVPCILAALASTTVTGGLSAAVIAGCATGGAAQVCFPAEVESTIELIKDRFVHVQIVLGSRVSLRIFISVDFGVDSSEAAVGVVAEWSGSDRDWCITIFLQ